jgi:hypothetical protein
LQELATRWTEIYRDHEQWKEAGVPESDIPHEIARIISQSCQALYQQIFLARSPCDQDPIDAERESHRPAVDRAHQTIKVVRTKQKYIRCEAIHRCAGGGICA